MNSRSTSFKDLVVWQVAVSFVKDIYLITGNFPGSELYGLSAQIRRAAVSIPSNIAEGQSRSSAKEFRQFLAVALGSLAELETQLIIAKEIGYVTKTGLAELLEIIDRIRKMLRSLAKSLT